MSAEEFKELVRRMRNAQKMYFATRGGNFLSESKELERRVDAELAAPDKQKKLSI